mmetsp:Transcript_28851/g.62846  ORF Transcript_28851/g.62846 Transcript_28851/m.62846 type:complete len:163 (-) Transcript_28851:12-500(-)
MGADGKEFGALTFPSLPPWPPSWEVRSPYLHWWLVAFMTSVGGLKAAGFLRHDLSRIAGLLELVGGLVFLPCWPRVLRGLGLRADLCARLGIWLILAALGVIASTKKRRSPVCWSQALLALELLRSQGGISSARTGALAMVAGTVLGLALAQVFDDPHKKTA